MPPKRKPNLSTIEVAEKSETNESVDHLPLKEQKTEESSPTTTEESTEKSETKERKRKKERKSKSNGRGSSAKQSRTSTRASASDEDEVDSDDSSSDDSDHDSSDNDDSDSFTIPRNNEDSSAWAGWTSNRIVNHWLLNNPSESQQFPAPKASTNNFLGSTYGAGQWKWREVGAENVNNWHNYSDYQNAVFEYNYRVGSRQFKMKKDNVLYEVSFDHRSEREASNHNNRRVIKRD